MVASFGGLAQRESACLTSKMSQVQSLYPPYEELLVLQGVFSSATISLYHFCTNLAGNHVLKPILP